MNIQVSDTNPFDEKDAGIDKEGKTKKTTMSYLTALMLSFNNLMTKKGRTILVSLAGSIGIIGIALILALSTGFQNYIDKLQEDTLSSYPLMITEDTADLTSMLLSMVAENQKGEKGSNKVVEQQFVSKMFSSVSKNDLKSFKKYIEKNYDLIKDDVSNISYSYSISPLIYSKRDGKISKLNPNTLFTSMYANNAITSMYSSYSSVFTEITVDQESLDEQFDVVAGSWPQKYNEMILVLQNPNQIHHLFLFSYNPKYLRSIVLELMKLNLYPNQMYLLNPFDFQI